MAVSDEEAFQSKVKAMSGHMFTVMWHVTELDIVNTVSQVCHKVAYQYCCSAIVL